MSSASTILQKVFVRDFYRANASFFLLIIGLAGGFMRSQDHIALAEFFISSWFLLLIPISIWILYALKITNFNQELLTRGEHEFVFHFSLLPKTEQWSSLLPASFNLLMPAVAYGAFLIALAIKHEIYSTVFLVASTLLVLLVFVAARIMFALSHPNPNKLWVNLNHQISKRFTKPYPLFFIEWIIRREPLTVIGTLVFCSAILFGILKLYTTDVYDYRLLGIGLVIVTGAQMQFIFLSHQFDNFHFPLLRQLPISIWKRISLASITQVLLILPLIGIVITYFPKNLSRFVLIEAMAFFVGATVFWSGFLYQKDRDLEVIVRIVFGVSILAILLILFKVPIVVLACLSGMIGTYWWWRYSYRFEYVSTMK